MLVRLRIIKYGSGQEVIGPWKDVDESRDLTFDLGDYAGIHASKIIVDCLGKDNKEHVLASYG